MLLLILQAMLITSSSYASPENCHRHWPKFDNSPFLCEEYKETGLPTTINGSQLKLFRYINGWNDELGQRELLAAATEAIKGAVAFYQGMVAVPNIYMVYYNEISPDDVWAEAHWEIANSGRPCLIKLFFDIPADREKAKQIVAHEVFHCAQRHGIVPIITDQRTPLGTSWGWWVEGSADYFSSLVYPNGNIEYQSKLYNAGLPLYFQPDPYSPTIFFAFLMNNFRLSQLEIINLLKLQPMKSDINAERKALSGWPNIANIFQLFGEKLVNKEIKGAYGKTLPHPKTIPLQTDFGENWNQLDFSVVPFSVFWSDVTFPAGLTATIKAPTDLDQKKVKVSYRIKGTESWIPLNPGREFLVNVACNKLEGEHWEFLVTTTRDSVDNTDFSLPVVDKKTKKCLCQQSSLPVDKCLVGNWKLDNNLMAEWMKDIFPSGENLMFDGLLQTNFTNDKLAKFQYESFRMSMMLRDSSGDAKPYVQTTKGQAVYRVFRESNNILCLQPQGISGTVSLKIGEQEESTDLEGIIEGLGDNEHPRIKYTCTRNKLHVWWEDDFGVPAMDWNYSK